MDREVGCRARDAADSADGRRLLQTPRGGAETRTGRLAATETSFYALGPGYTAWSRYDHNRIDLVPERKTYKPGETARIMIKSPWEQATALVTTEREGVRTHRRFALTSSQQAITVPITEADIPNVYRVRPARERPHERRDAQTMAAIPASRRSALATCSSTSKTRPSASR